jgi:hypothetical protein
MRKISCAFLLLMTLSLISTYAAVLTVNNSPNNPGQYAQIDPAIAAANVGDTIYVQGSSANYSNATITKSLTIIGAGTYSQTDFALQSKISVLTISSGVSNLIIKGLRVFDILYSSNLNGSHDILISNCEIGQYLSLNGCINTYNIIVRNNIFRSVNSINIGMNSVNTTNGCYNFIFENNIFNGNLTDFNLTNTLIQHNIFISSNSNAFANPNSNLIINNNIFYNTNPSANTLACVFNNNITYNSGTTYAALGGTNLDNVDPLFIDVPNNNFSSTYNYNLQTSSPGVNAASDGSDIGFYGGAGYVTTTGEVYNMPVIRKMDVQNTSVPQNGNVNVKVRSTRSRVN